MRTRAFRSVVLRRRDPARRVFTVSGRWEGMMVSVGLESGTSGGGMVWCEGLESGTSRGGGMFWCEKLERGARDGEWRSLVGE